MPPRKKILSDLSPNMSERLPLLVANHKENDSLEEVISWVDEIAESAQRFDGTIIFCPSYPFLAVVYQKISHDGINIKLGSQDISRFERGNHTGEVAASQIADIVKFVIIGHSERRTLLKEDDDVLKEKVKRAKEAGLEPIFCVQNEQTPIPDNVEIVAYEPVFAIGTGNPDTPENVKVVAQKLRARGQYTILYGGSVSAENVKSFVVDNVQGVLVGATNSLDPQKFIGILEALK